MNCKYLSTFKNYFYNLEQCFWSIANKMYWWSITLERYLLPNLIRVFPSWLKTPIHISAYVVNNPRARFDLDVTAQQQLRWKAGICESQTWWAGIGCGPSGGGEVRREAAPGSVQSRVGTLWLWSSYHTGVRGHRAVTLSPALHTLHSTVFASCTRPGRDKTFSPQTWPKKKLFKFYIYTYTSPLTLGSNPSWNCLKAS